MVVTKKQLDNLRLREIFEMFPAHMPIYKDSGRWIMWDEAKEDVAVDQELNETFKDFLVRCLMYDIEGATEEYWRTALVNPPFTKR